MASLPYQLLLVCLLVFAPSTTGQSPPAFGRVIGDEMKPVNLTDQSSVKLECPDKDGFIGVSDRNNSRFVSQSRMFRVEFSYRHGDFEDLKRVRKQKLGPYHCLYRQGDTVNAYAFVISELPSLESIKFSEIGTQQHNSIVTFTCNLSKQFDSEFSWERYSIATGTFEGYMGGSRVLSLTYYEMAENNNLGFTVYRCFDKRRPENVELFGTRPSFRMVFRPMRTTRYTSTLLPHYAGVDSSLVLECGGAGLPAEADSPARIIRKYNSTAYTDIRQVGDDNYKISDQIRSVELRINKLTSEYAGIYICYKDNVTQMAHVIIYYGNVRLEESGRVMMRPRNTVRCQTDRPAAADKLKFVIRRPNLQTLEFDRPSIKDGFEVTFNAKRQLLLKFASRSDMHGATVECHLNAKMDYAVYSLADYKLKLSGIASPGYFIMTCKKNAEYGNDTFNFYQLHLNGTRELVNLYDSTIQQAKGYKIIGEGEYAEFVCETQVGDRIIRSNKVTHRIPPAESAASSSTTSSPHPASSASSASTTPQASSTRQDLPSGRICIDAGLIRRLLQGLEALASGTAADSQAEFLARFLLDRVDA